MDQLKVMWNRIRGGFTLRDSTNSVNPQNDSNTSKAPRLPNEIWILVLQNLFSPDAIAWHSRILDDQAPVSDRIPLAVRNPQYLQCLRVGRGREVWHLDTFDIVIFDLFLLNRLRNGTAAASGESKPHSTLSFWDDLVAADKQIAKCSRVSKQLEGQGKVLLKDLLGARVGSWKEAFEGHQVFRRAVVQDVKAKDEREETAAERERRPKRSWKEWSMDCGRLSC